MSMENDAGGVQIDGYRVQVATMINPAAFWVVDCPGPDSGRIKVLELEKRLASSVRPDEGITTDVGHWVCIRNANTGAWHRGQVNNIIQLGDKYIYVVFLVDHGICLQVEADHLAQLSKAFLRPPFQAFEVVVDGLRPATNEDCSLPEWSREALVYVSQLLDTVLYTHFVPVGMVANKIHGELYLQRGAGQCRSLSSLLCTRGYAIKSSSSVPLQDGGPENKTKSMANSTENFVNDVEIDDGYISNYYIRKNKKNVKTRKKMTNDFAIAAIKEPEFASVVKKKAPAAGKSVVPLESCGSSPLGSGRLLHSVQELMKREDILAGGQRPFLCSQQRVSLRPASDTRGAVDRNAAAMYHSLTMTSPATCIRSSHVSSRSEVSIGVEAERPPPTTELSHLDREDHGDWSSEVPSASKRDEPVKDEASGGDVGVGSRSAALLHTGEAMLGTMMDGLRSRLDRCELLRETLDITRVLCHSHEPLQPLASLREAPFPAQIHKAMEKLRFKSAFNIQLYAWAAILERRSTFVVSPACSGKTLAYVLPLLSKCMSGMEFQQVRPGSAPIILVLCPGYETARFVYYVCSKVLQLAGICHVDIVLTHGGGAETEVMTQLLNGCHMLVSTPRCWLRLYQRSELLTNLSRLSYLVLEDADVLLSKFPEVKQIVQMCKKVSSVQSRDVAFICVAETWTKHIRGLAAGLSDNACVCFGSCLEAAVYANLQPNLYFIDSADKDKKVISMVAASYSLQRTVVVCVAAPQVLHVLHALHEAGHKVLGAHEHLPSYDLDEVRTRWLQSRRGNFPILVCSDDVILEMNVTDASILVHYSLPANSKTQFGFRFSCLMDNFQSIFSSPDILYLDCCVHVLVDSSDTQQFPTLIDLVKRLGGMLSAEVLAKYTDALDAREKLKLDSPVCQNVKAFGSCWKMHKCHGRHFFDQSVDQNSDLPRSATFFAQYFI